MFDFMVLQGRYFHHGSKLMDRSSQEVEKLASEVQRLRDDASELRRSVHETYASVKERVNERLDPEEMKTTLASDGSSVKREGWLNKLSGTSGESHVSPQTRVRRTPHGSAHAAG